MQIKYDLDLSKYNSFRIKSLARRVYFPETETELIDLLKSIDQPIIIGGGCNIILSKSYYQQDFVIISDNYSNFSVCDTAIHAEAGLSMPLLSKIACNHSLSGLEYFYDIPGTIGGGIVMNAGAQNEFISDLTDMIMVYDMRKKKIIKFGKSDLDFGYRASIFQKHENLIVLSIVLKLRKSNNERSIMDKMIKNKKDRERKQPREFPNAGSVFKRPKGKFVGAMIESLGLKGYGIGDAMVSEKHAGFIINKGGATGEDIISLITEIKRQVKEKFNIDLEIEQRII